MFHAVSFTAIRHKRHVDGAKRPQRLMDLGPQAPSQTQMEELKAKLAQDHGGVVTRCGSLADGDGRYSTEPRRAARHPAPGPPVERIPPEDRVLAARFGAVLEDDLRRTRELLSFGLRAPKLLGPAVWTQVQTSEECEGRGARGPGGPSRVADRGVAWPCRKGQGGNGWVFGHRLATRHLGELVAERSPDGDQKQLGDAHTPFYPLPSCIGPELRPPLASSDRPQDMGLHYNTL